LHVCSPGDITFENKAVDSGFPYQYRDLFQVLPVQPEQSDVAAGFRQRER
jgi:hypothetical protein